MSYKSIPLHKLVPLRYRIRAYIKRPKVTATTLLMLLILALADIGYNVPWTGFVLRLSGIG